MKYIRTKDGILKVDGYDDRGVCVCSGKTFYRDEYIKQADTIEELCDAYVVKSGEAYIVWQILSFDQIRLNYKSKVYEAYGAIWNDKGLIYVAKMNENGELELI